MTHIVNKLNPFHHIKTRFNLGDNTNKGFVGLSKMNPLTKWDQADMIPIKASIEKMPVYSN